jgi:nitroimidazol reductase NimA-like FMN-containing flavoprotein (pyridoxamine 5'-phosphate oxidase superfamily)
MSTTSGTEYLTDDECWSLLDRSTVARLAIDIAGHPDIFPINYVVDGRTIVFRSGAGTKLAAAVLGRHVAVEIDGQDPDRTVWSVVVKGTAREVDEMFERFEAEDLPLYPWIASEKPNFVRIEPTLVTGRRFHIVDGVDAPPTEPVMEYHPGEPQLRPD